MKPVLPDITRWAKAGTGKDNKAARIRNFFMQPVRGKRAKMGTG